ncbi:MAG TPA: heavy metal translocating P-type ATPase [Verrucomicrobiae bacterium]|nr:heavy metal translocating P-type ATPase [Verrucomicrobiae bacterium]
MKLAPEKPAARRDKTDCLARSVVDTLAEEPALEAVTIDRVRQKISVATLGKTDVPRLTENISGRIQKTYNVGLAERCALLQGKSDCEICAAPLSPVELQKITIRNEGDATTIARATCPTAPKFWRWRDLPLPKVVPREIEIHDDDHAINEWKAQLAAAILCGVLGIAGALSPAPLKIIFYVAAYFAGGFYTVGEVWERLQKRAIDIHFLMLFVAGIAAYLGAWGEGATLLFLFSLSGALEHFAMGRTQKEIRSLFRAAPKTATALDDAGREREVAVENLRPGMKLLIKPGSQFPVDGEIAKGATTADESNLTGEATPVEKNIGETVLAGTINLWGAVEIIATKPAAESALQRIIELIKNAQQQKAPAQQFTDKFSTVYTYFVLGLSLAMYFVWWLVLGYEPLKAVIDSHSALYRAGTLLVVSSPCALVLSIPSAVLAAIAFGARHGILFRGGAAVEKLAEINVVALDKTGTLTTGELRVEKIESFPPGRENEIARLAYSLEKLSTHPLARAVTRFGKQQKFEPVQFERFESITGHGLRARCDGKVCLLGRREWFAETEHGKIISTIAATDSGVSEIWVSHGGLLGRIFLRDDIRPQAREVIDELRREKLRTIVLTGDRKSAAEHLREQLHLDDVRAELKPEQKVEAIRQLSAQQKVAMVGDGVNDAPSLAAAHIGVAMGARGADAALEQADVVLMNDRLENFLAAFRLSRRARGIIRWNLVISLGTVVVLVTFAMLGKIPLTVGVVGHEGSTVIVVMNSLRLLFGGRNGA